MSSRLIHRLRSSAIVANSFSALVVRGSLIASRTLLMFLVARIVTPAEFGLLSFLIAAAEIAKPFADLGVDNLSLRDYARAGSPSERAGIVQLISKAKAFSGTLTYLGLIAILLYMQGSQYSVPVAALGLLTLATVWTNLPVVYYQSMLSVGQLALPIMGSCVVTFSIAAAMVYFRPGITPASLAIALPEVVATFAVLIYFSAKTASPLRFWPDASSLQLFRRSWPIASTAILSVIYSRIDILLLNNLSTKAQVGYYGIAYRVTEPFIFVMAAFCTSIYAHLSAATVDPSNNKVRVLTRKYLAITTAYGTAACLAVVFVFPFLIRLLLPKYGPSILVMRILGVTLIFRCLNFCLSSIFQSHGRFKVITTVVFFDLMTIMGLAFLFVPALQAEGAALALFTGEAAQTVVLFLILRRVTKNATYTSQAVEVSQ